MTQQVSELEIDRLTVTERLDPGLLQEVLRANGR